ncbi:serine/threonine-protein kinase GA29083 [Lycorma delicatula]|uniref:serine/threonine-protein kinase GA29083 n=1 Tax=Lycorma delicatula TaxID=130591 RepID=UPI003F515523
MSLVVNSSNSNSRQLQNSSSKVQTFPTTHSVEVQRHVSDFTVQGSPQKSRKAKRIRFLCNGDRFCKGVVMAVTPERYRSFDSLLSDLTRALSDNVNLPSGVRILFTMDGRKISQIDDLEDGKFYVCSGLGDSFKRVDYGVNVNNSFSSTKVKPSRSLTRLSPNNSHCMNMRSPTPNNVVRPRIIIVIRNGTRPRKVTRILLNKRNAPSFDHALSTITETVKLDTGAVRKVFTSTGKQVINLQEFFGEEDVFFVYGSERPSQVDFEFDFEELKAIQAQRRGLRRTGGELKSGTHCLDELGRGIPKMPNKTKALKLSKRHDSNPSIPNKVLSKYCVGLVIGDGNFAVVRRCFDKVKNIECALKIIDKSKCAGKEHMIENEVAILRSVQHPNIIRLIAEHDTPSELYLVMELVKGGDLFDAISKAVKFPENDAQIMTQNLASALAYLHELNIVHRDIKPENLLVEMDGDRVHLLKVGDFGLAQRVTEPLFTVCGTPTYVAPEILIEVGYGLKIDVWAAGVILYILLCGFPPFVSANNDQEELFDDILSGQYGFPSPYWDDVSDLAKDLISHMLQSSPELRFSAEDVLDHPWSVMAY